MKKFLVASVLYLLLSHQAKTQGCVAIRSTGGFCTRDQAMNHDANKWMLSISNRYFKSFRHFVGTEEQKERLERGTEVINYSYTLDLALTRNLGKGWSMTLDVPIVNNARSSMYEHGGNNAKNARHYTRSFGVGDIRIAAYRWLFEPSKMKNWNIQFGLGLKLPTGDYRYQDFFIKNDSTRLLGYVDQSIQLGDGGTGFTTEINAYYNINSMIGFYGNFYYLFNPREQNGVSTARGGTPSSDAVKYGTTVMSVPDQMMIRAGASLTINKFTFSAGIRDEAQPSKDVIGGSMGFRRPGYIISIEPGVNYQFKNATLYAYGPFAVKRNRVQSNADKLKTAATGVYAKGDAAFADYLINVGCAFKF
ncbi:transporter [Niastella caeni]|uniref:Transporter n=1 Tax=Niastella caeni TaxID=2569763 RepID=A0A4S8I0G0_9BACT|nr:transporter [Niastella caeni]THU41583.1 transporter [Niastella caeni]